MEQNNKTVFVGSRQLLVEDKANDLSFPVLLQYPTAEPSSATSFGPYTMEVSADAAIMQGQFPLVIISHGNGGSHLIYRSISMALAMHGYIVAMPEHFGNNRNNNSLQETITNLQYRPRHISLVVDELLASPIYKDHIAADKIAVIGHSMGGYTALALAGGIPRTREGQVIPVTADPRIKAIVLMAPGTGWFYQSLQHVTIPILLLMAEYDAVTPAWNADVVVNSVPDKSMVTLHTIKNAGHFSFISPFPDHMKSRSFIPSTDPDGFDREAFHRELPSMILSFLNNQLGPGMG